jgi:hypothetical protein
MRPHPSCRVYFMRPVGERGPVKIGCSGIPRKRLAAMSVWSPVHLEIVAEIPGDEALERRFHAAFRDDWTHGEWFAASERMDQTIAAINDGTFDLGSLPEQGAMLPRKYPEMTPGRKLRLSYLRRIDHAFKGYYQPHGLLEVARSLETAPADQRAGIVREIEAAMTRPAHHAKPIDRPWAEEARAKAAARLAANDDTQERAA